jgi:hypothetical protein
VDEILRAHALLWLRAMLAAAGGRAAVAARAAGIVPAALAALRASRAVFPSLYKARCMEALGAFFRAEAAAPPAADARAAGARRAALGELEPLVQLAVLMLEDEACYGDSGAQRVLAAVAGALASALRAGAAPRAAAARRGALHAAVDMLDSQQPPLCEVRAPRLVVAPRPDVPCCASQSARATVQSAAGHW